MYYVCVEGGRAPHHPHKTEREAVVEARRLSVLRNRTVQVYLLIDTVLPEVAREELKNGGENGLV